VRRLTADLVEIKKHLRSPAQRRAIDRLSEACLQALNCLAVFEGRTLLDNACSLDAARQLVQYGEAQFKAALDSPKNGESEAPPTQNPAIC
jgi:hypothetical protein